eukprot:5957780-Pleurochrysis_carterae.AAC.2
MVKSSAVAFETIAIGVAAGEQLGEVLGLQQLGAVGDIALAVVGLEQLSADLELICLVQYCADLLDVRLARDVGSCLLLDVRHLAVGNLVQHLAAVGRQLDAKEARKNQEEAGTWLREMCAVVMASAMARSTARVKPSR